jgi:hypothetical protein
MDVVVVTAGESCPGCGGDEFEVAVAVKLAP